MTETPLSRQIEENRIAAENAQNQQQARQQAQQTQEQQAQQQHIQEQEELQRRIAEYDRTVQQLEAEQKAEADKAESIKQAEQNRVNQQKAINDKYDSQISALGSRPSKYYYKPKYSTNRYTGKTRFIGNTRESNSAAIKNYNSKVDAINRERKTANQQFGLANSNLPQWAKTKAARAWNPTSFKNTSAVTLAQRYYDNYLIKSERTRESSITTARSNAVLAREEHQTIIKEYESKRDALGFKLNDAQAKLKQSESQQATKSRPAIVPSSHFKEEQDTPSSIYGTTQPQSQKAKTTYDELQEEQKSLFHNITGAASWNEAIQLRKSAMHKNSYVGTANELFYKDDSVGSSGSLLSLNLESVSLDGKTEEPLFTRRKKEKEFLNALNEDDKSKYTRNQDGDLTLLSDDSLAVKEPQLEPLESSTPSGQRFTVSTPDGKERIFKDEITADKFIERTNGSYKTNPSTILTDGKTPGPLKPEIETSHYVPGSFDYIFEDTEKQRRADEIKSAGGTYGDYLQTLDKNTLDYQLKEVGLGAKRAYNSYTGLVGFDIINPQTHGRSLLDSAFDDTVKYLKNPSDPKPFLTTTKAIHERSPAQHTGDLITTGAVETGLFLVTGGIGNLAVRGASKLPYLLKSKIPTATQYIKSQKESQLATIKLEDGSKVKLTNFDYGTSQTTRPTKFKQKISQKIDDTIGKRVRKTKFENDMYNHNLEKQSGKSQKDSRITKFSRKIDTSNKLNKDKIKNKIKDKLPDPKLGKLDIHSSFINSDAVRKIATKRLPKKDKGKKLSKEQEAESGQQYNDANNDNFLRLEDKTKLSKYTVKNTKKSAKDKPKQSKKNQQTREAGNYTITEQITLHPNRPKGRITEPKINLEVPEYSLSTKIDVSDSMFERARASHQPKIFTGHSSRLQQDTNKQLNIKEPELIKDKISDIEKQRKKLDTRFSLIVRHGSRQKEEQEIKDGIRVATAQSHSYRLDESIKIPTKPVTLGIKLPGIDGTTKSEKSRRGGKFKKGFYRWNTDNERVGVYLPTADLHTGRTRKVITKVDRLERKTHTSKYQKTKTKKHQKFWTSKPTKLGKLFSKSDNSLFTRKSKKIKFF